MPIVRLVIRPMGVSRSGRLRVRVFTDPDASRQYSIDPRRITALYRVKQEDPYNVYIAEYETSNPEYELYRRSNEYASTLIHDAEKVDSIHFIETRYHRYSDTATEIHYRLRPGGIERICEEEIMIDADDYCVIRTTCPPKYSLAENAGFCGEDYDYNEYY